LWAFDSKWAVWCALVSPFLLSVFFQKFAASFASEFGGCRTYRARMVLQSTEIDKEV
jgi:hypothetical protein